MRALLMVGMMGVGCQSWTGDVAAEGGVHDGAVAMGSLDWEDADIDASALSYAVPWNLLAFGDYSGGKHVEGRVAAAGIVALDHFSVGEKHPDGPALVAGQTVLDHGTVFGDLVAPDAEATDGTVEVTGTTRTEAGLDFDTTQTALVDLSRALASVAPSGDTVVQDWFGVELTGSRPDIEVFTLEADDLSAAVYVWLGAHEASTVIVNIHGKEAWLSEFGFDFEDGPGHTKVLLNFVDAERIHADSLRAPGLWLAPHADVVFNNGSFDGTLVARSVTGDCEFHHEPFAGSLEP